VKQLQWRQGTYSRVRDGRSSRLSQGVGALAVGTALALLATSCGASTAKTAAQNLAAGIAAQNAGNYAAATADYNKVLAAEPENADALFDLGDVEQFQHLDTEAVSRYQAALAVDPNFVGALYNLAILSTSASPVEAETLYEQAIRLEPNFADAHFNLGLLLISLGQKAQGQAQIRLAVALEPSLKSRVPKTITTPSRPTRATPSKLTKKAPSKLTTTTKV
jgi:tetratricopeptide (TPR) repeat protein